MKNKLKKISISAGILGILLVTVGITYAVFSYSKNGIKGNSITSGNIVFHYGEGGRSISLENTSPMTDEQGKAQTNYFDFTITSKTNAGVKVPYTITVKRKGNDSSLDSGIKLYLTEVANNTETDLYLANNKIVSKYSELATYTNASLNIDATKNEKVLYKTTVPQNANNYEKNYRLRMWVSDDYNFSQTVTGSCSDPTYTTRETCVAANKDWTDVATSTAKTFTATINVYAEGNIADSNKTLLATVRNIVKDGDYEEVNSYGKWQVVNESVSVNEQDYTNILYTGANPNNYVWFNDEMWRIIGVYNEDTHGQTGKQLVKIIRNDTLIVSDDNWVAWDLKETSVGSSVANNGSDDWSDSQLMLMLNGETAINKGKLYDSSPTTFSTLSISGDYILASQNGGPNYKIWNKSLGSYLSYDENGDKYINKDLYGPATTRINSYTENIKTVGSTLSRNAQNLIAEVDWHLGGIPEFYNSGNIIPSVMYNLERGNVAYYNNTPPYYSTTSTTRSTLWTGKVALMYASDYGYATSGGDHPYRPSRMLCTTMFELAHSDNGWYTDGKYCSENDWLLYENATAESCGTKANQWTLTINAELPAASKNIRIYPAGNIDYVDARYNTNIRPVVFLTEGAKIEDNDADGSYNNPYRIIYE